MTTGHKLTKWDCHGFRKAQEAASMSKDPSTQVGAVIVDRYNKPVSEGFNGFASGIADTPERYKDKEFKYAIVLHAELNAVLNANKQVRGCTLYCMAFPCPQCASVLIQVGIARVLACKSPDYDERWADKIALSKKLFEEVGIPYVHCNDYDRPFTHPSHFMDRT